MLHPDNACVKRNVREELATSSRDPWYAMQRSDTKEGGDLKYVQEEGGKLSTAIMK